MNQKSKMPTENKTALKVIFFTLFLDLIGFSIIFPLFPALVKYYLDIDPNNFFLKGILDAVESFILFGGQGSASATPIVLFGGALAAIYSLLQFICSPFWGSLSDRIGRKPILLLSITGSVIGYLIWFFAGSFTLVVLSRLVTGIMAGNISTATAVVGDITTKSNRSKGMAIIGVAFGIGFVIGPTLGGIFSLVDLSEIYPHLKSWGINPFSMPAFVAFALSLINLVWVAARFKESLPPEKRNTQKEHHRTSNILKLFQPLPYRNVNLINFSNLFYTMAFAGMEFTLTFLAFERLGYSPMQNAYLFIYIGVLLALIQGGVVRRSAHKVGERKMALLGLLLLIPGLFAISWAWSSFVLYVGLTFLSIGSAMVIACLSALVSLFTPENEQGKSVGVFRSLGALGRVLGPIAACLIYWKYGSGAPYTIAAIFMLLPIFLIVAANQSVTHQTSEVLES